VNMRVPAAYGLSAALALAVALASFVAHRNQTYREREEARALAAARAVAAGAARPAEMVAGGLVSPAESSPRYPFLRRRTVDGRPLGGPGAPASDKLIYDAAQEASRSGGAIRTADEGGARLIAALPQPGGAVAVALVESPSGPAPLPVLLLLALLALGALIAALPHPAFLALGGSTLAVPVWSWGGPAAAVAIALIAAAVAAARHRGMLARAAGELRRQRVAYTFVAPAALAMLVLVAVPFAVGLVLGFYDHRHGTYTFVGLDNFVQILSGGGHALSDPLNFYFTLGVTILWTAANVVLHLSIGVALALVLRQTWLGGRGIYRVLFILPWAIPNYITALIWNGMFQSEYGAINGILSALGLDRVSWFSDFATSFTANVCANTWLGFPFMMVVALGALESIPRDMHEAADVDGASAWQRFVHITLPHLRPALAPAVVLGSIWTFNMFNVIYLVSDGQPGGSTDILVTQAYRWAFERGERYGLAAAYATIIFLILFAWTLIGTRVTSPRTVPSRARNRITGNDPVGPRKERSA
jgi:ABC-type sugar transport system permease subunit